MNTNTQFETYSFSHHDESNVGINLTFTVPAVGVHISTFHDMCRKFVAMPKNPLKNILANGMMKLLRSLWSNPKLPF